MPSNSRVRQGANTLGKAMGRRVNNLLSSFGSSDKPKRNLVSELTPLTTSVDSPSEEDDDLNADSDSDDSVDTDATENNLALETLEVYPRPCFNKSSMSPEEAEIKHLIQSETSFVDSLKNLVDFRLALYDMPNVVKKKHSDQMFMYVEELYLFHKKLLDLLRSCENNIENICSIFRKNSDNFRYHVYYISNIPHVDKIYNNYYDIFKQTNSSLGEDLRKPRMRLNYYILTFDNLKKRYSEEFPVICQIIDVLRTYLKEADTRLITDSVNLCPFNLMNHGHVSMSGELSLKKGEGLNRRRYQVLLLSDLLVLAKGTLTSSEYVTSFHLRDIELVHELRGVLIYLNVKLNKKSMFLIFKTKTIKLQQKWIEKLRTNINIVKQENFEIMSPNNLSYSFAKSQIISDFNYSSILNSIMPSLTIEMAFPKCLNLKLEEFENDPSLYVKNIQDSERLLIKTMDNILDQNKHSGELAQDIKNMYEFHLRYLYPALTYDKESFEKHVLKSILNKRETFVETYRHVLFTAAVLKYENGHQSLLPIFEIGVVNFFKYMVYFINNEIFTELEKSNCEAKQIKEVFEEILQSVNLNLKRNYISEFPLEEAIIMEGNLAVCEFPDQVEQIKYVILTQENTYLLSVEKSKFKVEIIIKNKKIKLGHPPAIRSFQIKFINQNKQKKRYNFTAESIEAKSSWISSYCKVLPQEFKRKELIRISGKSRTKPAKISSGSSFPENPDCITGTLSVAKRTSAAIMMESEL